MWFIYILQCSDGSLYTGSTNDIERRFTLHMSGKGAKYTRSHRPNNIIHTEKFLTKSEAFKREREIKTWTRKEKINRLKLKI